MCELLTWFKVLLKIAYATYYKLRISLLHEQVAHLQDAKRQYATYNRRTYFMCELLTRFNVLLRITFATYYKLRISLLHE